MCKTIRLLGYRPMSRNTGEADQSQKSSERYALFVFGIFKGKQMQYDKLCGNVKANREIETKIGHDLQNVTYMA